MAKYTDEYIAATSSLYWRQLRVRALRRAGYRCEGKIPAKVQHPKHEYMTRCTHTSLLQVDHLHYRTLGHEGLEDVQVLCDRCHTIKTILSFRCPLIGDEMVEDYEEAVDLLEQWLEETKGMSKKERGSVVDFLRDHHSYLCEDNGGCNVCYVGGCHD